MNKPELDKQIQEEIDKQIKKYVSFTAIKLTDTPTDRLQVTPMGYVNMFGSIAGRPQNSVIGQQYFSTDLGYPIFRNSNNAWVSPTGSVVG